MEKPNIVSVGFEGPHRSGKGMQIERLSHSLEDRGIPFLVVRGDGSRPNQGTHPGDPVSDWWSEALPELRKEGCSLENWNESSRRLARELIVFRDRVLPKLCEESNSNLAFLMVDRSILSRTILPRELGILDEDPEGDELYPEEEGAKGATITAQKVCPDIIFNFVSDIETLLSRLNENDPKYDFRKRNIENNAAWFNNAVKFIPRELRDRIVDIDANESPEEIGKEIESVLMERIPDLQELFKAKNEQN